MPVFERKVGRLSIVGRAGRRIAFTANVDRNLTGAAIEAVISSLVGRDVVTQARTTFLGCSGTQSAILVELAAADVKKLGIGTFGWRMAAAASDGDPQDLLAGTLEIKP